MPESPDGGLVRSQFLEASVALLWMIRLQIKYVELGLEGSHDHLVHGDIWPVKLQATNTILDIGIPSEAVGLKVKNLDVSIIVACSNTPLLLVVGIAKANGPTVRLHSLGIRRLETNHRRLLSGIPNSDAAVGSSSDELWCSILWAFSANSIDDVGHFRMSLDVVLLPAILYVKDLESALVVDCRDISGCNGASLESAALDADFLLKVVNKVQ